jgi:hypothetical protein
MTKTEYIKNYGYISNREFSIAKAMVRDYDIAIQDWKLPSHELLSQKNINLMIELRLHIKNNCRSNFKNNFYKMNISNKNRCVYVVNYTGHTLAYDGNKFSGNYSFCIINKFKKVTIGDEKLYFIDGFYPRYSITSCLEQDITRVKSSNASYITEEPIVIEITAYTTITLNN